MRRILPIALVSIVTVSALAACAPTGSGSDATSAACEATPSGPSSDSVSVTGDVGGSLTVEFEAGLAPAQTERTVVTAGSGDPAVEGKTVNLFYSIYNGATDELIEESKTFSDDPVPFVIAEGTSIAGLNAALLCAVPGDRLVAVIPPADAFGDEGAPDLGLNAGESLVFVADVESVEDTPEATATPSDVPMPSAWTENVPQVTLGETPVVTLPDTAPPAELELVVLEEGDGEVVENGATVTVDYQGISWDTGEIFDQSYGRGEATFATSGVIPGFAAALVGQKVGSTVLVTIPPEYGYGTDPEAHELGGQTLVFLVEIHSVA